ncbi:MAG: hypothetical protein NVSMB19_25100 [Vulcanimicrobiaceae bacterium]
MFRLPYMAGAFVLAAFVSFAAPAHAEDPRAASPAPTAAPSATPSAGPMDALAWRNVGPTLAGGRLAAIAGSDKNPALVYIGSAGGGVWKSTNGTTSWKPVFDAQHVGSIGAIAIAPGNSDDVWVGTGESNPRNDVSYGDGVYRSSDGGKTWRHLGLEHSYAISKISLDPKNPEIAVVAALGDPFADNDERGVYRTVDGGRSWKKTLALAPDSGAADLDRSAREPNVLFAAMWQFRRSSWHLTSGGANDGLFKSVDGGATWKRVGGNGFPAGTLGRIGVAIAPSDSKRIYALIESNDGIVWRSDDGGTHWQLVSSNSLVDERPFYYSRIFVDPANADHVFTTSVKLAESGDGGKRWALSGKHLHGDHHALWFSADGKTVLEANDGGPAISRDNGATWEWRNNVPIGQAYRVATDARMPYDICVGLQDNGSWCGPSNGRSNEGILPRDWHKIAGGDGNWTIPDPLDPDWVWASGGGGDNAGALARYNRRTRIGVDISPYLRNQNVVAPRELAYRFNWESPLAFSPFDGHVAYYGGSVLFQTSDGGLHWKRISPDLTRDIKARQGLSGTPLRLDVTGAETYDTLLDVVPSTVARGQIWITTDDGKVQLTRDGGEHWLDVTMAAADMDARVPTLEASHRYASVAYAVLDRHFTGDRAPYVYATRDFGRTWTSIVAGLPASQFARSIVEDPNDPDVLFLGLENSVWWSGDRGTTWRSLQQNLPPTSVRDLRISANGRDLIAGTHGRGVWVLDDIAALERPTAHAADTVRFFRPATAFQYESNTPTVNVTGAGANPPGRAIVSFFLPHPATTAPTIDVLDANDRVVRRLAGTHDVDGDDVSVVSNVAGFNRATWDLTAEPPVPWTRAPKWNQGPENGADIAPGSYRLRLNVDGAQYVQPLDVRPDPRANVSAAHRAAHVAYSRALYDALSRVDAALNELDNVQGQLPALITALPAAGVTATRARDVLAEATRAAHNLSSYPVNGQDNDFLRDLLRERVQSLLAGASILAPTAEQRRESGVVLAEIDAELARHAAFMRDRVAPLQTALREAGIAPLDLAAKPVKPKAGEKQDEHGERRGDD